MVVVLWTMVFLISFMPSSQAQDEPANYVRVVMFDGTSRMGELVEKNSEVVRLRMSQLGEVDVPKYLVKGIIELTADEYVRLSESIVGRTFALNPQSSRYFFAPSGIQLKRGEGYFQSNIALNSLSMGVTDHVTIGGLISFVGAGGSFKIGKEVATNVHASFGGIGFTDYFGELENPVGLAFANVTWGTEDRNFTVNLGMGSKFKSGRGDVVAYTVDSVEYTWDPGNFYEQYIVTEYEERWVRPLILNLSGMSLIGDNRWFITENYFVSNRRFTTVVTGANIVYSYLPTNFTYNDDPGLAILSMGVRNLSTRNGWLWDYGIVGVLSGDYGFAAPWISATLAF